MIDIYCPIRSNDGNHCIRQSCAWWDEERKQCCFKTQALAAVSTEIKKHQ